MLPHRMRGIGESSRQECIGRQSEAELIMAAEQRDSNYGNKGRSDAKDQQGDCDDRGSTAAGELRQLSFQIAGECISRRSFTLAEDDCHKRSNHQQFDRRDEPQRDPLISGNHAEFEPDALLSRNRFLFSVQLVQNAGGHFDHLGIYLAIAGDRVGNGNRDDFVAP